MTLTLLYHLNVVGEIDVSQVLDDDVESGAEVLHHLLLVRLVVVVEDVVGPAFGHHVHAVLGAGRAHHRRANSPGHTVINMQYSQCLGSLFVLYRSGSSLKS